MFEVLSATGGPSVAGIGWLVTLLSLIVVVLWLLYLYR
jgi:hypothetical protein